MYWWQTLKSRNLPKSKIVIKYLLKEKTLINKIKIRFKS